MTPNGQYAQIRMCVSDTGVAELHVSLQEAQSLAHRAETLFGLPDAQEDLNSPLTGLTVARRGDVLTLRSEYSTDNSDGQGRTMVYLSPGNTWALARKLRALLVNA